MATEFRKFLGLKNPVRLDQPDIVLPLMRWVFANWPHEAVAENGTPFAQIGPVEDGTKWRLVAPLAEKPDSILQPVNAICDLVCEVSWERLRSRPDLLCLHAAAVPFGDRLVIFPNQRRAGKSLLTATLARKGHAVFTDDFVPLAVDPETRIISGVANGIAPRLRLPLPDTLSPEHAAWIEAHITTRNKQYGYLSEIDLPLSGTEMPVGAIVMLDRDMELQTPATLSPVAADEAFAAIMKQNFGRQVHSGAILTITEAITASVPVLRLTYRDVDEAAELLRNNALLSDLPAARITAEGRPMPDLPAPVKTPFRAPEGPFDPALTYKRADGVVAVQTEQAIYVADPLGHAIRRLNASLSIFWTLLEEPVTASEMAAVMQEIYPDVPPAQLHADAEQAVRFLWEKRLAVPTG